MHEDGESLEGQTSDLHSRDEFVRFVYALQNDIRNNPLNWENQDIETYLGALAAFLSDADGYYRNAKLAVSADLPSWRLFADCLLAARIYE